MNSIDPADDVAVQIRFWSTIVSLPAVWIPLAIGSVILLSGYPTWLGATCLAVGAAVAAAVVFTQSNKYKTLAKEDLRRGAEWRHMSDLRSLRRRLRGDDDYRSNQLVRDLRDAYTRMQELDLFAADRDAQANTQELKMQTRQLYLDCFQALNRTHELWKSARDVSSETQSSQLLAARKTLMEEVAVSLRDLSETIDFMQTARLTQFADRSDVEQARAQLQRGLEVARKIQQRLNELEDELNSSAGVGASS